MEQTAAATSTNRLRSDSYARTLWLLTVLVLLLVLSGKELVAAAMANAAQADLARSAVTGVRDLHQTTARFERALRIWPGSLPAQSGLWRSLALAGRYEEAQAAIEALLTRSSQDEIAAMTLGLLRLSQGDRDGALQAWKSAGAQVGDIAIRFDLARDHGEVTFVTPLLPGQAVTIDRRLVRDLAEAALRVGHSDVWMYLIIGNYYRDEEENPKQALYWYMAGRQAHPANFIPPAYAASLLFNMGRPEESRRLFREASAKCRCARDDYAVGVGKSYLAEGQPELALPEFERAVSLAPDNAEWRVFLGEAFLAAGQPDRAREQFETAVRLAPDLKAARIHLERLEKP